MLALYRGGRQADALEAYRHAREVLVEQLGIEPGAELHDLHEAILAHDPGARRAARPPAGSSGATPALPTPANGVDRARRGTWRPHRVVSPRRRIRLLTLIGPGGVGKTRLALAAAARVRDQFADGAYFVSLAPLADHAELAAAIAVALGVPVQGREPPTQALLRFLAGREVLLVLDNFEHLLAGHGTRTGDRLATEDVAEGVTGFVEK